MRSIPWAGKEILSCGTSRSETDRGKMAGGGLPSETSNRGHSTWQ
jgi:hypothetical protein